jgi:hypothetical protein
MKSLGILSFLIGISGALVLFYFEHKAAIKSEEFGGLVSFFTYGRNNYFTILILEFAGLIIGCLATIKTRTFFAIVGFTLCALNLIHLFSHSS